MLVGILIFLILSVDSLLKYSIVAGYWLFNLICLLEIPTVPRGVSEHLLSSTVIDNLMPETVSYPKFSLMNFSS